MTSPADIIARPKVGYWADAWRRFRENKIALVALIILVIMVIMVIIGHWHLRLQL